MAQTLGELVLKLQLDQAQFQAQLNKIQADSKRTATNASTAMAGIGNGLKIAAVAIGVGVVMIGKSLLKAASNAEETDQKFGVIFGSISEKAKGAAAELSASFGLARNEAKNLLADTGNLLQSFGAGKEESLEFSKKIVALSADLISFTNNAMGVSGAVNAITKSFLGEGEQLKSLGKTAYVEQLKEEAKALGKNFDAMTQLQKAHFTFDFILKKSKNEIGDMARSSGSWANQMRFAESNVINLKESLGQSFLPIATLGLKAFNEMASSLDKSAIAFRDWTRSAEGSSVISERIGHVMGLLAGAFEIIRPLIDSIKAGLGTIIASFENMSTPAETASAVTLGLASVFQVLGSAFTIASEGIAFIITSFGNLISVLVNTGKAFYQFFQFVAGNSTWEQFTAQTNNLKESVIKAADDTRSYVNNQMINVKDIFSNATGGAQNSAKKASDAYARMSANMSAQVKMVLMAKQEAAKSEKEILNKQSADMTKYLEKIKKDIGIFTSVMGGVNNIIGAVGQLTANIAKSAIDGLEAEKQARYEAAGVAEETEVMKAQAELTEAEASGNAQLIGEKRRILERAKIDEEFTKKKAKLEFQAAETAWGFQVATATAQMALGIASGISSGAQAGWPLAAVMMPLLASMAAISGGIQLAAVIAAKPKAPRFETGGIVPGNLFTGDNVVARLNSREMVLTEQQQANLFKQANVEDNGDRTLHAVFNMDGKTLFEAITKASFDKRVLIFNGALV